MAPLLDSVTAARRGVARLAGRAWGAVGLGERAWTGAAVGLLAAAVAVLVYRVVTPLEGWTSILAAVLGVGLGVGWGLAAFLGAAVLALLPARFRFALCAALVLLWFYAMTGTLTERGLPTAFVAGPAAVAGAAIGFFRGRRAAPASRLRTAIAAAGLAASVLAGVLGVAWLLADGYDDAPFVDAAAATRASVPELDLPDPSQPGPERVLRLFYGSGTSARRPEYGPAVPPQLRTRTVDGSRLLRGWNGLDGWARSRYWRLDARTLPINGRVFYPDGAGPFPIVIAVHGGHTMGEASEPGYDYLGEHLASHGYVFVSVDENFLNAAAWVDFGGGLGGENPARGWLLLEHLRALRGFHEAEGPLHGKLDLGRIALVGHSKGGEAIALAALFNRLPYLPDDASLRFDYGFGIRALVALATTDRQYQPSGAPTVLEGVDFLALQGSNDGDVETFQGAQQYERVKVKGPGYHLKETVYVHRANHGQWNSVWGHYDKSRFPRRLFFNRRPLLPEADQERVARAYLTAFFAVSLRGDTAYLPFLRDHRAGRRWLPDTVFVNRFEDSASQYVARFDEDVDVTTTTIPGGRIRGRGHHGLARAAGRPALALERARRAIGVLRGLGRGRGPGRRRATRSSSRSGLDPRKKRACSPESSLVFALADAQGPFTCPERVVAPARAHIDLTVENRRAARAHVSASRSPRSASSSPSSRRGSGRRASGSSRGTRSSSRRSPSRSPASSRRPRISTWATCTPSASAHPTRTSAAGLVVPRRHRLLRRADALNCAIVRPVPGPFVLRCDRLFDGERFLPGPVDVHVEGGVIARMGPPSPGSPPAGVVVDARGSLVMPGLVNAHVHMARGGTFEPNERISLESVVRNLRGTLAAGVTTVGDMGSTAGMMRALRAHTARSPHAGPALVAAGPIVTAPGGYPLDWLPPIFVRLGVALPCADERAGAQAVERIAAGGMDHVKIAVMHRSYADRPLPALEVGVARAVVGEAHRLGLRVLAHAHGLDDYAVALGAGVDALMHSSFDPLDAEMVARVRDAGVPVVPTLWVFESACLGAEQRWDRDPGLRRHVAPYVRASWSRYADAYAASGEVLPDGIAGGLPKARIAGAVRAAAANLVLLADAGVPIAFGNDASYGFSLVGRPTHELAAMQRAGLPAEACLRAATSRSAALLGRTDRGVLAPGKRADILVVDPAAETDVSALERIRTVIAGGEVVDPATAWSAAGVARTGAAFARGLAGTVADAIRARGELMRAAPGGCSGGAAPRMLGRITIKGFKSVVEQSGLSCGPAQRLRRPQRRR